MDDKDKRQSSADPDVEAEIRQSRKFSTTEAMARLAGPGAMKGASPVSRILQAETEIGNWLNDNLPDANGILEMLLLRNLKGSELVLANLDHPLAALEQCCERLLRSDQFLTEFVRQADAEWGQRMDERPHFDRHGSAPHPDDPYTAQSVRHVLADVLGQLAP